MSKQLDVITTYFDLVQAFTTDSAAYAAVLHPDVEQTEYPNLLQKTLQKRSFDEMVDNFRLARELLRDPQFEMQKTQHSHDGGVIVEGIWQATATRDIGPLLRGQRIIGQVCLIFEFKDDKIYRQRRYACYDMM
ncbi:nuclear transport factor 2 family protein [Hymenobacter tenuis]